MVGEVVAAKAALTRRRKREIICRGISERYGTFRSSFSKAGMSGFRMDADDRFWRIGEVTGREDLTAFPASRSLLKLWRA